MRQPKSARINVPKRTLISLEQDLYKFDMNDGNVGDAKRFNNVTYQSLFHVPIDQVACKCLFVNAC